MVVYRFDVNQPRLVRPHLPGPARKVVNVIRKVTNVIRKVANDLSRSVEADVVR